MGGNTGFLLNIPPDSRGRFGARDEACLIEVGNRIRATYGTDLAANARIDVDGKASILGDGKLTTFWQPPAHHGSFVITLPQEQTVNRFVLQEAIDTVGQRIKAHALDAWVDGAWEAVASATTVGYKRILRFPAVTTDRFRIRMILFDRAIEARYLRITSKTGVRDTPCAGAAEIEILAAMHLN